jgi:hypothetical protein
MPVSIVDLSVASTPTTKMSSGRTWFAVPVALDLVAIRTLGLIVVHEVLWIRISVESWHHRHRFLLAFLT